jgi:hypothetical protein
MKDWEFVGPEEYETDGRYTLEARVSQACGRRDAAGDMKWEGV